MNTPERPEAPLATPEQAGAILREAGELTTLYATHGNSTYELVGSGAPAEVSSHFPDADDESVGEVTSVSVLQGLDPDTGMPAEEGTAATVTFKHTEQRDDKLSYVTQVDYAINVGAAGSVQPVSRHISSYEVGPHRTAKDFSALLVMHALAPQAMHDRHDENLAAEHAMGLQDVTQKEAEGIRKFLEDLKTRS